MTDPEQAEKVAQGVHLGALFTAFLTISLCGVGGGTGIVWARRIAVENRRWVTDGEFADIISLCQFMPGPNIIGIAVCVGAKMRGAGQEICLHRGPMPAASSASLAAQLMGRLTSPSQAAVRAEMRLRVQEVLGGMDALDREILALRHF